MKQPIKVAVLVGQQVSLFELGCALELFALPRAELQPGYDSEVITFDQGKISGTGGIGLKVNRVSTLDGYETLIVPGWQTEQVICDELLLAEMQQFYKKGGRILSFCSGSFLLAETGLLNGLEVTTHWRYADLFRQRFPQVDYVDHVLYTYQNRIGCSAGSAAALDLGLEIIRQDFGGEAGNLVARRLVVAPHRNGGQSQFVDTSSVIQKNGFSQTLDWALNNLSQRITIDNMVKKSHMSRRSFDRHFRRTFNMSAKEWLSRERLKMAQQLLEKEHSSMDQIAVKSGFESAMNMRHYFRQYLGISPSQYRSQFQQKDPNAYS